MKSCEKPRSTREKYVWSSCSAKPQRSISNNKVFFRLAQHLIVALAKTAPHCRLEIKFSKCRGHIAPNLRPPCDKRRGGGREESPSPSLPDDGRNVG
jgi:hypothetical protein